MTTALMMAVAVALDWLLGEPRRWHPLVGFGRLATALERRLHRHSRGRGLLAWAVAVIPLTLAAWALGQAPWIGLPFSVWALYFALGHKSLHEHLEPVAARLEVGDEAAARALVARVVSRDPETLEVAPSAVESALENGNDGVFGALFWFAVAGAPGAILYRLANTLDAMWGYRNERYRRFGWAAARLDDLLNYLPARLAGLTYALLGAAGPALRCWRAQAPAWDGINPGVVMAAGAGALGVRLGGPARYGGEWHSRPVLGLGGPPQAGDIRRALRLVRHGVVLWLVAIAAVGVAHA